MKNEFDIQWALTIVNKICAEGDKVEAGHELNGLKVFTDPEGYNVTLDDGRTQLHIGFHNTYEFVYPDAAAMTNFINRMKQLG